MEIRPVRDDEVADAGDVLARAYGAYGAELDDVGYLAEVSDVAARRADNEVLVAVDGGRVLGAVTYVPGPSSSAAEFTAADGAGIRMLGVDPAAAGRGVGEALTRACLERAAAAGRGLVVLHTTPFMTTAQRLYQRLGFERAPELDRQPAEGIELQGYRYWLDAASLLAHARHASRSLEPLAPHLRPATLAEGYVVQDRLAERLGLDTLGWKIGATNAAAQQAMGVDEPFCGRLLAGHVQESPTALGLDRYVHRPLLECEIGARLGADLVDGPFTAESVAPAVAEVLPTIEVVDFRFGDRAAAGTASIVADNGGAADLVVGPATTDWRGLDLAALRLRLVVDGDEVASGTGDAALGHPLAALAWLARHRAERGAPLRAGDLVSTGTCTGAVPVVPGSEVVHDAGPLGEVRITWR